jgi:ABC-type multidrug transport system fused ATPase/permease subunit
MIAIAHRLSTVRSADRIVVMEDGAVIDAGPHAELLSRCELYRRLVQTQLVG